MDEKWYSHPPIGRSTTSDAPKRPRTTTPDPENVNNDAAACDDPPAAPKKKRPAAPKKKGKGKAEPKPPAQKATESKGKAAPKAEDLHSGPGYFSVSWSDLYDVFNLDALDIFLICCLTL